jgi:hypothetical protein
MKAILVALALVFAGCGDDTEKERPASGGLLVLYERGGGIASQPQRLEIGRDGHAQLTVQTGQDVSHRDFEVSGAKLDDLEAAVEAAAGVRVGPLSSACADCFIYTVRGSGVDFQLDSVSYSDDSTPDELSRLTAMLEQLAE